MKGMRAYGKCGGEEEHLENFGVESEDRNTFEGLGLEVVILLTGS
jgi:hypothetical protein